MPAWTAGSFDIHHINTGRGNATFLIAPDGTTILIDAGAVPDRPGPQLARAVPDNSRGPGEWIGRYVKRVRPGFIDYGIVTHFHDDHMAGISDVFAQVPIRKLIDRGSGPENKFPPYIAPMVAAYRAWQAAHPEMRTETLQVGRADQIRVKAENFEVRNLAANGLVWTGTGTASTSVFPADWAQLPVADQPTENSFSIALRFRYGAFDYFTGGDLPGIALENLPAWHDLETPVAKVTGPVDVCLLNHHGWLDSTNSFFLAALRPRVVVVPVWSATHPDHGVLRRLISPRIYAGERDLFATNLLDATKAIVSYLGNPFAATQGHIVVRVEPGGGRYRVYAVDDRDESMNVLSIHGPYRSR